MNLKCFLKNYFSLTAVFGAVVGAVLVFSAQPVKAQPAPAAVSMNSLLPLPDPPVTSGKPIVIEKEQEPLK